MTAPRFDPASHARAMREQGLWLDLTIDHYLADAVAKTPDKLALVSSRADRGSIERLTYRELSDKVARAAGGLRRLGIGHGDVVAVQLANWIEFVIVTLACGRLGAVLNPLMPIFRERELAYMLQFAEAKAFVVPKIFRQFDHASMAYRLQADLPLLKHVIVVDGDSDDGFEQQLLDGPERIDFPINGEAGLLRADELAVLMFTSGTAGAPKGVMHTYNTLLANNRALGSRFGLGPDEVLFACSPMGHMTGFVAALILGLRFGGTVVLQDVWEAKRGVALMAAEGVTYVAASTPFLSDICEVVAAGGPRPRHVRNFLCGGASIPPALIQRAERELEIRVCSLWGMTEILSGTLTEPERALEKSSRTDGRALDGVDIRIVDEDGRRLPVGDTGRLQCRGPQNFIGYYKRPDIECFDAEGWFDSGDLAYMDEEGYIRINGRIKDVLIRGGENVPVFEIESLLYSHPAVAAAAIVGYPDDRLGERACAFVVLRPGAALDLRAVQAYMEESRVAKQYWPERIEIVEDLPCTPTGKVQKFKLRQIVAQSGEKC